MNALGGMVILKKEKGKEKKERKGTRECKSNESIMKVRGSKY